MKLWDDLKFRGLVNQASDEENLQVKLDSGLVTLYVGFDPTADSLHLGNLLLILALRRFQEAGHCPIALAGGGTGLVGDPSFRAKGRDLGPDETIAAWNEKIKKQLEQFLDFETKTNPARVVNNYDWLAKLKYLEFLRDIGKHFPLNDMIDKESVESRLKTGMTFTEFNYMLLQAYDFMKLYEDYSCVLQLGGSDQWGNIISGVELIRKKLGKSAFALTLPLMTKADGSKFGKSSTGTIWLDKDKTSPYEFYQFLVNTGDKDVVQLIKYFTFLSHDEINDLERKNQDAPEKREAQKALAQELTKLVHGEAAVIRSEKISDILFGGKIKDLSEQELGEAFAGAPKTKLKGLDSNLIDILVESALSSSKRQAREDLEKGAISVNGEQIKEVEKTIGKDDLLFGKYLVLRRGKKNYHLVSLSSKYSFS